MEDTTKHPAICTVCSELKDGSRFAIRTDQDNKQRKDCMDCCNKRINKARATYRKQVFDHYGWECKCCGEAEPAFLVIDHIHNDGYLDRMKYGRKKKLISKDLYYKIIFVEKFPENKYQPLCHNCNSAKWDGRNGRMCPHEATRIAISQLSGKIQEYV
jgi:hypothetical protein